MRTRDAAVFLVLILVLASCSKRLPEQVRSRYPELSMAQCQRHLSNLGVKPVGVKLGGDGHCQVHAPIEMVKTNFAAFSPRLKTSCAMALAWLEFEAEVEQLALSTLGTGIAEIRHYGSFSCRAMSGNSRRTSLHSSARALDVSGFDLDDGRSISVLRDWGEGAKGKFLRLVAVAGCEHFSIVLTPAHDNDHHDHLHFDIGPWRLCGV